MFGLLEEEIDPGVDGYNASTTTKEKHPFKLCLANTVHRERDREREREGEREKERRREREGGREGRREGGGEREREGGRSVIRPAQLQKSCLE